MSIKISTLVWQHYPAGGRELLTALAYADHAHDDGTSIRPSVAYVAKKTRQSERMVQRYLASMRKSGWLQAVRFPRGGRGRTTEYQINPVWISSQRTTVKAENSDVQANTRMTGLPPQPPLTINESTPPHREDLCRLSWPKSLQHATSSQVIRRCPPELQQSVLDEIAALEARGKVRSATGLLKKLVELAIDGEFSPTAAKNISVKVKPDALQNRPTTTTTPPTRHRNLDRTIGREHLNELKQICATSLLHRPVKAKR